MTVAAPGIVLERLHRLPGGEALLELAAERDDVELVGGAVRDLLLGAPRASWTSWWAATRRTFAQAAPLFASELAARLGALADARRARALRHGARGMGWRPDRHRDPARRVLPRAGRAARGARGNRGGGPGAQGLHRQRDRRPLGGERGERCARRPTRSRTSRRAGCGCCTSRASATIPHACCGSRATPRGSGSRSRRTPLRWRARRSPHARWTRSPARGSAPSCGSRWAKRTRSRRSRRWTSWGCSPRCTRGCASSESVARGDARAAPRRRPARDRAARRRWCSRSRCARQGRPARGDRRAARSLGLPGWGSRSRGGRGRSPCRV